MFSWVSLSKIRNSLISRVVSTLSISALVLSNIPQFLSGLGVADWSVFCIYVGSLVFVVGYLLFSFFSPREFVTGGEITDHVHKMMALASTQFIENRLGLADKHLVRLKEKKSSRCPIALKTALANTVADFNNMDEAERRQEAPRLFQDALELRAYDHAPQRYVTAVFLFGGLVLVAAPTLCNVGKTILLIDWV